LTTCVVYFPAALSAQEQATEVVGVVPPERRPYNVRLLVAIDPTSFDETASRSLVQEVTQGVHRCAGGLWSFKATRIDWLRPVHSSVLTRLDRPSVLKHYPDESADVWFLASIESLSMGARVSLRSWQPEVQFASTVTSIDVLDRREIAVSLLRLCRDLIRPMGTVEHADRNSVRIRLRAGELSPPDPSFTQVTPKSLLLPMLAFLDKNKTIERWQTIPWTYIAVDEIDGSTVQGTVKSGFRSPVSGKKRSRLDTLVVLLKPELPSTQIELLTQTKPKLPLVAHRIEVRKSSENPPAKTDEINPTEDPALLYDLLTDRLGQTRISVEPDYPMVWLFAYSGEYLLARVPCVPGIAPQLKLEVPDDSARLTAEADLQMLQGEVIDAVALRNTAIATIRAASRRDDWETVGKKLELLKKIQDDGSLNDRLIAVRVAGTAAAKARKDRAAEVRINRICDDTAALIKAHLGSEKIRLLVEEMEVLKGGVKADEKNITETPADSPP
jgi:hypothetical protein